MSSAVPATAGPSSWSRRGWCRALVATLVAATSLALVGTEPASAAVIRPFGIRYQANINGAIDLFGNTLMTCPTSAGTCAAAQNPANGNTTYYANNSFNMVRVDADGAAFTTASSSRAAVTYPPTATLRFAGLYWAADSNASTRNQIKFRRPGDTAYATITATQLDVSGTSYQAFANVTSLVAAAGPGDYWGADVALTTGTNQYAGWSLVTVWEDASLPLRNLTVFDGYGIVQNTTADRTITIPLSGFLTPPFGPVQAEVGVVAYEGDRGVGGNGDNFRLNTTNLSNVLNPADDVFNGSISDSGVSEPNRTPAYVNQLGFDVDEFDASGLLGNGATTASVTMTTGGETYYPGVITTAIDLFSPSFPTNTKSVTNLTRGTDPALPGDVLEYQLAVINNGLDGASNSVITDALQPNTTYVPGSLEVLTGANSGAKTDGTGDDQAEYLSATRTVKFRIGTGADATSGGTLNPSQATTVRFRVTVDPAASGTTVSNSYRLDYRALTLGIDLNYTSNTVSTPVAEAADLRIVKTASPDPVTAGSLATYTVTVTNNGPKAAQAVQITDTLPSGATLVSATPSVGSCVGATCTTATLAFPGTMMVTYVVQVAATLATGDLLTNEASVVSATPDPRPGDEVTRITTSVTESADVRVTKTASPNPLVAGGTSTWTVTVTNVGPSTARSATVTDALPTGLAFVSATPSTGTCPTTGATVECALGDIAPGASVGVTIVTAVAANLTGSVTNTANAGAATPDPDTTNNSTSLTVPVSSSADLQVTKTAQTDPIVPGTSARWMVTVRNVGPSDAQGVTLTDPAPAGVTWTLASPTVGTCTLGASASCTIGTIAAGGSVDITLSGDVAPSVADGSTMTNRATATSTSADPDGANNVGTSVTPVRASVVLQVAKTASPDPVIAGTPLTYTVTVHNLGPSDATNVTVADPAPTGITYTVQTPTSGSCAGSTSANVACNLGTLASGATATVTITADVDPSAVGTPITNVATVDSDQTVPQTATFVSTVTTQADIRLSKRAVGPRVVVGTPGVWELTYTNVGPSVASDVTLTDDLPPGMTATAITGASCTGVGTASVACSTATLAVGASVTVQITVATSPALADGAISNTATVGAATPPDPTQSNNSASGSMDITRSADVQISKVGSGTITPGLPYSWTVTASNVGPSTANSVVVSDTLPAGMTFDPTTSDPRCSGAGRLVTCTVAELGTPSFAPPAASTSFTIGVTTAASLPSGTPVSNEVQVSASTTDPDPSNNVATATAAVVASADLAVAKAAPASVTAGRPGTWTVTVTNAGPSDAQAVALADAPPTGVSWTSITSSLAGSSCGLATGACTLPTLAAGATWTLTFVGDVDPGMTGSIDNTAQVAAATADPDLSDNTALTSTPVVVQADLRVTKVPSTTPGVAGNRLGWLITVTNLGPSTATAVRIDDTVSSGLTLVDLVPSAGTCTVATGSCVLGDIPAGSSVTVGVTTLIGSDQAGTTATNTATASSPTPDPELGQETATASVPVTGVADLTVLKQTLSSSFLAGGPAQWTITVTNNGFSDAVGTVITDPLPSGIGSVTATPTVGSCTVVAALSCALGNLSPGQVVFVVVRGTVASSAPDGSIVSNTATATSTTPDPNAADNTATSATPVTTVADLVLTKAVVSSPASPGLPISWTISATNRGLSDAQNLTLTDPVPSGVSNVAVSPSAGCVVAATVTCTRAVLAPGATVTWTLTGDVDSSYSATSISNTASVTSSTTELDPADNTATSTTPVVASADLSVTKSVVGVPVAGGVISWQVAVSNAGPSVASGVQVVDVVPVGVSGVVGSGPAGTSCSGSATVTCTLAPVAAGSTVVVTLVGTLASGIDPAAVVSNTASVSSSTPDGDLSNNSSTVSTPVGTSADVRVVKVASGPFTAGQVASWTITVSNAGPSTGRSVSLSDALPVGLLSPSVVPTAGSCGVVAGSASCALGDVVSGGSVTVTVSGTLDPGLVGPVSNSVSVSSSTPDPDGSNNSSSVSTPVATSADLSVMKSAAPATFTAGLPVTYTVVVSNAGPSVARSVTVVDSPAPGMTFEGVSSTAGTCDVSLSCSVGDVPAGGSVTITIQARPDGSFAHATNTTNTVSASSSTPDPLPGGESSSVTNEVRRVADLSVAKSVVPVAGPMWLAGELGRYTVSVTNLGPSTSGVVTLSDQLASSVTFDRFVSTPAGMTCGQLAGVVSCDAADIPIGAPVSVVFDVRLDAASTVTSVSNTASVSQTGADDPDPTNDSAATTTPTGAAADLVMSKTATALQVTAGSTAGWTLRVENAGPSAATRVEITDTLPAGLTWDTVPAGCVPDGSNTTLVCTIGTLASGAFAERVVTAAIDPDLAAGPAVNSATASSPVSDPTPGDNTASSSVDVVRAADLQVTKTASAATAVAGTDVTWVIAVDNLGPSSATDVTVADTLPTGLTFVAAGSDGRCSAAGPVVTCALGTLAPGASDQVAIVTAIGADTDAGPVANTSDATSTTPDPTPGDNASTATVDVTRSALVRLTKTASTPFVAGGSGQWTITITNDGRSTSRDTAVTDTYPTGFVGTAVTTTSGTCTTTATDLTCTLGTVAPAATITITVDGTVDPAATGTLTNTATTTSTTPTPDPTAATDTATTSVLQAADLSVTKTADADVVAGEAASWTIVVRNDGPSVAQDVTLVDPAPSGLTFTDATTSAGSCTTDAGLVSCDLGTMASSASITLRVVGTVSASAPAGPMTNSATVESANDLILGNNTGEGAAEVTRSADLTVTKTASAATVTVGDTFDWTIAVSNAGPSTADAVVISDPLPAGVSLASAPDGCEVTGSTVTCALSTVDVGASSSVTIKVTAINATQVTNVASVSSATADPTTATASSTVTISGVPGPLPRTGSSAVESVRAALVLLLVGVGLRGIGRRRTAHR